MSSLGTKMQLRNNTPLLLQRIGRGRPTIWRNCVACLTQLPVKSPGTASIRSMSRTDLSSIPRCRFATSRGRHRRSLCTNFIDYTGRNFATTSSASSSSSSSNESTSGRQATSSSGETERTKTQNIHSNSNPSEVQKFSSFASHWWDSRSNPLVGMNPVRIRFMRDVVEAHQSRSNIGNGGIYDNLPLENKRVLDIGCGGGLLTESLSRLGASLVVGVDASSQVVEVAKRHTFHENSRLVSVTNNTESHDAHDKIRYVGGVTVEELATQWLAEREKESSSGQPSVESNSSHELFDIVTALEIIEHVPNPSSLLQSAISLLKPNGILFVSTINRTMKSYGLAIVAAEYITGKVPVGTHDWNKFLSPLEVGQMVCRGASSSSHSSIGSGGAGSENASMQMKQVALSGMVLQPPFLNMEWELNPLDTDINWIGAYQKQTIKNE